MSVIYKEREREREWDTSSRSGGQGYTTVRRYKIPDHSLEQDSYESEMRLVHRGGRSDFDDRRSTKDYVEHDREVREYRYQDRSPSPRGRDSHSYRIQRSVVERSPSPATVRELRIQREYERDLPQREDQYSLEKYSRDIEYFREPERQVQQTPQSIYIRNEAPPPQMQMQPIIIREEAAQPIIIREREPAYELIERSEVQQERQVAPRPRHEEDYYYERRVKEVDRGGRHESRYMDEREYGRDRYGDRSYYSDDDVVYVHKEKDTWGSETNTKRDVAAGALAGVAAGQIIRHHRKRKGEAAGGNIGNALGYGTLGAVSAVALDKFNNRERSRSSSSDRGRRRRHHSQGRGRSKSRVREIGALAAIAGVGALAYAAGRKNKDKGTTTVVEEHRHRSRSRKSRSRRGHSRRGRSRSVTVIEESDGGRSRSRSKSKHTDPKHRNNRVAQVGLASAAVAGLAQRQRSKSRKRDGKRSRSHSRIREGVPIAAAGVAGAAVTGLYEKHKAKKEARALSRSRSRSKSRSRSRSVLDRLTGRSRSRRGSTASEPVLVEYGGDPIYTERVETRTRGRRRRGSSSSSDGRRHGSRSRSRSKSRARSAVETAAVAGVAGLAAHEAAKRRDRKKAEKEREKRRDEDSAYSTGSYSPYDSPRPSTAHPNDSHYFPQSNYFPPPPTAPVNPPVDHNAPYPDHNAPYPPYNPADYPPPPSTTFEPNHPSGYVNAPPPSTDDLNHGNPYARPSAQNQPYYGQPRHPGDNVSASAPAARGKEPEHVFASSSARGGSAPKPDREKIKTTNAASDRVNQNHSETETERSLDSPAPRSEKTVQFDLNPMGPSREASPSRHDGDSHDKRDEEERRDRDDHRHRRRRKDDERSDSTKESGRRRKRHHRDQSPGSDTSDATIDLPPRFDEQGRRRGEDPVADKLESVLQSLFR